MTTLTKMVGVAAGIAGLAYWVMKTREQECFLCTNDVESGWVGYDQAVKQNYICKQCALKAIGLYPIYLAKLLEGMSNPANGEQERAVITERIQLLQAQTNELAARAGLEERV